MGRLDLAGTPGTSWTMPPDALASTDLPTSTRIPRNEASSVIRGASRRRRLQQVLFAAPAVMIGAGAWVHRWVTEDAFIYFRIVDNLFAGHGPVFNATERVEAGTGTLWTALLALGRLLLGWLLPLEWIAVLLGLALAAIAVVLAQLGAAALARGRLAPDGGDLLLPAGIVVVVALPPMWDFATSGLETSLELAWLAAVFWVLARGVTRTSLDGGAEVVQHRLWVSALIGLGPLVRPDLAIFTVVFLGVLWNVSGGTWRDRGISLACAAAIPAGWQVFRMGYYGTLVPNTAIAKSAGSSNWEQGWNYLADLVRPYWLTVPAVLLLALVIARAPSMRANRNRTLVATAPVLGATLLAIYVIRLGGDFMHARFLLPAAFALLLPVAVVPVPTLKSWRGIVTAACLGLLVAWSAFASRAGPPYARGIDPTGIADERGFWERAAGRDNPITLSDFQNSFLVGDARAHLAEARRIGLDAVVIDTGTARSAARSASGAGIHLTYRNIGVYGVAAGPDAVVLDPHGLSDPIAARVELAGNERARPGHEKNLPAVWILARHAAPTDDDGSELRAARHALGCGELRELLVATGDPLTLTQFARNVAGAAGRTRLAVPADPFVAERAFCR